MSKILVSGFTFIKNGLSLGYPIKESIESIEPLCDEIVINVGFDDPNLVQDDGTYQYLRDHFKHPKFIFLKSHWSPESTAKGLILSEQTNIALRKCSGEFCQYIQGDEVIHEDDLHIIHNSVIQMKRNPQIQGLIFKYTHFYGNVDIIKETRNIYRREVRLIRNGFNIKSHLDAQGFKNFDGTKLKCKQIAAKILHYGWARKEQVMQRKVEVMDRLYHGKDFKASNEFNYQRLWGLKEFKGTHPKVMQQWIKTHRNDIDIMSLPLTFRPNDLSLVFSDFVESLTGLRIGEYKNFIVL